MRDNFIGMALGLSIGLGLGSAYVKAQNHNLECNLEERLQKIEAREIWSEGYQAHEGEHEKAKYFGSITAPSFKQACVWWFENDEYFDPDHLTHWSCQLFDNEADARKSFG